jgi:hypothetical protein
LEDVGLEETTGASDPDENTYHEEEHGAATVVPAGDTEGANNIVSTILEARSDRKHRLMKWS